MATLYVARHGLRANADPPPTGIDGDPRLTSEGVYQAEELGAYLARLAQGGTPITAIYSSPFYRCIETAVPASRALGLPIFVERGISEHYVPTRPTKPIPWPADRSREQFFKEIDVAYASQVPVSPEGETRDDLRKRVKLAMQRISEHAAAHGHSTYLVVTHAAIKITIAEVLVNQTVRAGTCSVDTYGGTPWRLEQGGDTHFLSGGEQMNWSFDMAVEAGSAADEASRSGGSSAQPRVLADGSVLPPNGAVPSAPPAASVPPAASAPPQTAPASALVSLDTSALPEKDQPTDLSSMFFVNMETDRPLIQIGDRVYEGEWQRTVGTEVYTGSDGAPVGASRTRIRLTRADVEVPARDQRPLLERLQASNE